MSEAIAVPMGTMHAEQLGDPSLVQQVVEQQESRRSWREQAGAISRKAIAGIALTGVVTVGAIGGGIYAANRGEDGPTSPDAVPTAEEIVDLCEDIDFNEAAKDSAKYNEQAFLPFADKVEDENGVRDYVSNLFKSPLGGDADMHSLAALMALVGEPANDGAGVDVNYDFLGTYAGKIEAYGGEGGAALAEKDCKKLSDTLKQVAKFNPEFVFKGDTITTFDAVRGAGNTIVNMSQDEAVSTDTYRAIELSLTSASRDLDEFNTVGIVLNEKGGWSGRIIATGINQGKNGKLALEGETPIDVQVKPDGTKIEVTQLPDGNIEVKTTKPDGTVETEVQKPEDCNVCEAPSTGTPVDRGPGAPTGPGTPNGPGTSTPGTPNGPGTSTPGTPTTGVPTTGVPTTGVPTTVPHSTTTVPHQTTTTVRPTTTTTPQTTTTVRPTTTTTTPDVCPNIPGSQPSVPPGMEIRDGICKEKAPVGGGF